MEKLKRSRLFNRLNSMSIRMSFVLYALFSLLIGIIICILLISMVDKYRINLNYKYENMSTRYDIPENGSFTATYSNDQTKYTIFDTKGNEICKFNVDYQKEIDNLYKNIKKSDYNIGLDLSGKMFTSVEFAEKIDEILPRNSNITFIIGGSLGLNDEIRNLCDELISFSKMTFPHGLFRGILLEQIYRACKINNHEMYHK